MTNKFQAPNSTPKFDDYPLSAVHDLFDIFRDIFYIRV